MKKIVAIAVIALGSIGFVQAQEIDFGVQAGVNFAKLTGENINDADGRTGINVGLTAEYMFNPSWALNTGAIYSQQGLDNDATGRKVKLDYINVPVLARYYIAGSGFAIDAGPQIGFIVNDEIEIGGVTTDIDAETIDLSVGAGLNYKFKEGQLLEGLDLGVRYMYGVTNVYEDNQTFSDDLVNSVLSINLGYKF